MPIYDYKCEKCSEVFSSIEKYEDKQIPCKHCEGTANREFSVKFNATGLPNGFSSTRSKSRGK